MSKMDFKYKTTMFDEIELDTLLYLLDILPDNNKQFIENIIKNNVIVSINSTLVIVDDKNKKIE